MWPSERTKVVVVDKSSKSLLSDPDEDIEVCKEHVGDKTSCILRTKRRPMKQNLFFNRQEAIIRILEIHVRSKNRVTLVHLG